MGRVRGGGGRPGRHGPVPGGGAGPEGGGEAGMTWRVIVRYIAPCQTQDVDPPCFWGPLVTVYPDWDAALAVVLRVREAGGEADAVPEDLLRKYLAARNDGR